MDKLNYLNVGCGSKYHKDWVNIDMSSDSENVIAVNLLNGIPFPDNTFDVVYHSQVLEHIPKEKARFFINECFRVLKPDGILRVVVPDLENIVDEYKKYLIQNIENPTPVAEANYDWILLEMYDQTVRNCKGGQMAKYIERENIINENYVNGRIGLMWNNMRKDFWDKQSKKITGTSSISKRKKVVSIFKNTLQMVKMLFKNKSQASQIGQFRLGGEVHMWMYDRYSLAKLLKECGFSNMCVKSPYESNISGWANFELDVKDGLIYDPSSLFMEAEKK